MTENVTQNNKMYITDKNKKKLNYLNINKLMLCIFNLPRNVILLFFHHKLCNT